MSIVTTIQPRCKHTGYSCCYNKNNKYSDEIFNKLGQSILIKEEEMNKGTAISSSGLAYLAKLSKSVSNKDNEIIVKETFKTYAELRKIYSDDEIINKVSSKKGMTEKGLNYIEKSNLKKEIINLIKETIKN